VDGNKFEMGKRSDNGRGMLARCRAQPGSEAAHEFGYIARWRRTEDGIPRRIDHAVLALAVFPRRQERTLVPQDALVDLADDRFVGDDLLGRQTIGQGKRLARSDDLPRFLLADAGRAFACQQRLDLDVGKGVSLDPCRAVNSADPCTLTKPLFVGRVDGQVVEQPAPLIEFIERLGEGLRSQPILHVRLR
jgi:hypothetical protein